VRNHSPHKYLVLTLTRHGQNKQLQLQLGPDDVLRGRYRSIPTIRARAADLAHAEEPRPTAAAAAGADRGGDAGGAARGAGDRVSAGHVPGRGADGAANARAERGGHVRVSARACDLERVGDGRGQRRGGRRACTGSDVALFVCAGRAWGCDAVAEHSAAGTDVRSRILTRSFEQKVCRKNRKNSIGYDTVIEGRARCYQDVRWQVTLLLSINVYNP